MRALVKAGPGPGMVLREVAKPSCGPTEVLIRVRHAGVCGTDLHIWEWDSWASQRLKPPVVVGHEFAGEIVELGHEAERGRPARRRRPGDRRGPHRLRPLPAVPPGRRPPVPAHPDHRRGPRRRLRRVHRDAGLQRHEARRDLHRDRRHHGPDGQRRPHRARRPGCPAARCWCSGCGPIGCFAVGVARAAGASLVIASDFNARRLELARAMGAQVTLDPARDDVLARVRELTGGDGVDLVCEMSGHPGGSRHRVRGRAARRAGQPAGHAEPDHRHRLRARRHLQGPHALRRDRPQDVRDLAPDARFLRAGQFDPQPVITHRFPLECIGDAIQVIKVGRGRQGHPGDRRMSNPLERRLERRAGAVHPRRGLQAAQLPRQPAGGAGADGGARRGHHPLLQQLPRPERRARGGGGRRRPRSIAGAPAPRRCASSAAPSRSTASSRRRAPAWWAPRRRSAS